MLALVLGGVGGVLLGWGLKDAAPFIFFSTEREVAARDQGEALMLVATALLAAVALLLFVLGRRLHSLFVGAFGLLTLGLLHSPVGGSIAPHAAFLLLAPAAAAALCHASGIVAVLGGPVRGGKLGEFRMIGVGLALLATLYLFVNAAGPVGAAATLLAPFVFMGSLRLLKRRR